MSVLPHCRYLRQARDIIQDQPYYRHVAHDLMRVTVQVAEGMVREGEREGGDDVIIML